MAEPARFFVDITSNTIEITAADVWPAGDGPVNPTAADVAKALRSYGSRSTVMSEWAFDTDLRVAISEPRGPSVEVWV